MHMSHDCESLKLWQLVLYLTWDFLMTFKTITQSHLLYCVFWYGQILALVIIFFIVYQHQVQMDSLYMVSDQHISRCFVHLLIGTALCHTVSVSNCNIINVQVEVHWSYCICALFGELLNTFGEKVLRKGHWRVHRLWLDFTRKTKLPSNLLLFACTLLCSQMSQASNA